MPVQIVSGSFDLTCSQWSHDIHTCVHSLAYPYYLETPGMIAEECGITATSGKELLTLYPFARYVQSHDSAGFVPSKAVISALLVLTLILSPVAGLESVTAELSTIGRMTPF